MGGGYQPALDALFPEQEFDFEHPEEILIAANDSHLVIAGRDRWNPAAKARAWTRRPKQPLAPTGSRSNRSMKSIPLP